MVELEKEECCGCSACENICPIKAITMKTDKEGFWYPIIDEKECIKCNLCEKACPIYNLNKNTSIKKAYAAYNKNDEVRLNSSSGGIFTILAEQVLGNKGIVFGAGFNKEFDVIHFSVDNKDDLYKLRGSKYVQSDINVTYKEVKMYLNDNKIVLFSGTPCQISGLRSFLMKKYDNLICIDVICHGVPSPKVWSSYRQSIVKEKELISMTFRDKSYGWKKAILKYTFKDGSYYKEKYNESKYIKGFIENIYLRPSCYNCRFKSLERDSDFTLADFWGNENVVPEIDDEKGISLVIAHNNNARKLIESFKDRIYLEEVDIYKAIDFNICAIKSVKLKGNRRKFYRYSNKLPIGQAILKATRGSFFSRAYRKIVYEVMKILQ